MPLSRERQRQLDRAYKCSTAKGEDLATCAANAAWWNEHCSVSLKPYQYHYYRREGVWHASPYLDTSATEWVLDLRYRHRHGLPV